MGLREYGFDVAESPTTPTTHFLRADQLVRWIIVGVEYAIVGSLLLVAGIVLVHTAVSFLRYGKEFSNAVVAAIDGILVVIIILDIAHTVFGHLRTSVFPVRPFLVIGILAGVLASLLATKLLRKLLFGIQSWDIPTLIAVAVVLAVATLLASYIPARRAASVNPVEALRAE